MLCEGFLPFDGMVCDVVRSTDEGSLMSSKAWARLLVSTQTCPSYKPSCPARTFPAKRAARREHHGRDRANFPSQSPQERK